MGCACTSGIPIRNTKCNNAASSAPNMCNYQDFGMDSGDQTNIEVAPGDFEADPIVLPTYIRRNETWSKEVKSAHIRFFNEPIEQVPGYRWDQFQILIHGCKNGLRWWTPVCVEPVICVCSGEGGSIEIIRQKMYVISDKAPETREAIPNCTEFDFI